MTVTTRGDKQTIDPPMSPSVEDEMTKDNEVVENNGELVDKFVKEVEIPPKKILVPRQPPPIQQRLVKETKDGKYRRFITMLKPLSINFPLIEALEKMTDYERYGYKEHIGKF